jgi:3-dehydroquinate synthetase
LVTPAVLIIVQHKITPDLLVKNLVGTFKAPEFVVVNLAFWDTLPREEIRSGLCELIKNVLSIHPQRYEEALTLLHPEATYTTREYHTIFTWCFEAKQAVMREDAHEQGPALILEYGHTVGHALETLTGLKHGFAIGVGMLVAAHLSQRRGYVSEEDVQKHSRLLEQNGAPTTLPRDISLAALLKVIRQDNKIGYLPQREGFHAMVLLRRLGLPLTENGLPLTSVSEAELREAILAVQERL